MASILIDDWHFAFEPLCVRSCPGPGPVAEPLLLSLQTAMTTFLVLLRTKKKTYGSHALRLCYPLRIRTWLCPLGLSALCHVCGASTMWSTTPSWQTALLIAPRGAPIRAAP